MHASSIFQSLIAALFFQANIAQATHGTPYTYTGYQRMQGRSANQRLQDLASRDSDFGLTARDYLESILIARDIADYLEERDLIDDEHHLFAKRVLWQPDAATATVADYLIQNGVYASVVATVMKGAQIGWNKIPADKKHIVATKLAAAYNSAMRAAHLKARTTVPDVENQFGNRLEIVGQVGQAIDTLNPTH